MVLSGSWYKGRTSLWRISNKSYVRTWSILCFNNSCGFRNPGVNGCVLVTVTWEWHYLWTLLELVLFTENIISLKVLFSKFKEKTFETRENWRLSSLLVKLFRCWLCKKKKTLSFSSCAHRHILEDSFLFRKVYDL